MISSVTRAMSSNEAYPWQPRFLNKMREVQEMEKAVSTHTEWEFTIACDSENCRRLLMFQEVTILLVTTSSLGLHQYELCPQDPAERDYAG